jgi:hypothetical protein
MLKFLGLEYFHNNAVCNKKERMKGIKINAIVEQKYFHPKNHNYPTIEFRDIDEKGKFLSEVFGKLAKWLNNRLVIFMYEINIKTNK